MSPSLIFALIGLAVLFAVMIVPPARDTLKQLRDEAQKDSTDER
jgi:hypothetical protein